VQNAQRIGFRAALAVAAHPGRHLAQSLTQQFDVTRPAVLISDGVEDELKALESRPLKNSDHHFDYLGIDLRRPRADCFGPDLIELPVASLLRTLAAEHRAEIIELLQPRRLVETVLDVSSNH